MHWKSPSAVAALLPLLAIGLGALPCHADLASDDHALLFKLASEVGAQQKLIAAGNDRISQAYAEIAADHAQIAALKTRLAENPAAETAGTTYGPFTVTGNNVYLTGYNLWIQSGSGATDGTPNGLGNLIIGYDETRGTGDVRTGSHNLILGKKNNFSSYCGIIAGNNSAISGTYSSVLGGAYNTASANMTTILGGYLDKATSKFATVVGGASNNANAQYSSVSGGYKNSTTGEYATVGGGSSVLATSTYDFEPYAAGVAGLQAQVTTVQSGLTSLDSTVSSQGMSLTTLQGKVNTQSAITGLFTLSNGVGTNTELTLTGVNLHIVNGLGATDGNPSDPVDLDNDAVVNGLGNLIIGYNETRASAGTSGDVRTGSHNLIVGSYNNYSSFGGMAVGFWEEIDGDWTSISGGIYNTAGGQCSSICGGYSNSVSSTSTTVTGGAYNTASAPNASLSGGYNNSASGGYSSVSGGEDNSASGQFSSVSGGEDNSAGGQSSSVSGGKENSASGQSSSVSGGVGGQEGNPNGWAGGTYHSP